MRWLQHLHRIALRPPSMLGRLLALLVFGAVTAANWLLEDLVPALPFMSYPPAATIVTLAFGWRVGVAFLGGATLFVSAFWSEPIWTAHLTWLQRSLSLLVFAVAGVFGVALTVGLRRLLRRGSRQSELIETLSRRQRRSIERHETAFREMQHRVANNLQFVSNMLSLSQGEIDRGADVAEVLDKALARLVALGQLHRMLHDADSYKKGVEPILNAMLPQILRWPRVQVSLRIHPAPMSLDQMTAMVQLVTEAATNAEKHVFRMDAGSVFEVHLDQIEDGRLRLTIRDDGPPRPADTTRRPAPGRQSLGLGMRIMQSLALQLGGELEISSETGTRLQVCFAPLEAEDASED